MTDASFLSPSFLEVSSDPPKDPRPRRGRGHHHHHHHQAPAAAVAPQPVERQREAEDADDQTTRLPLSTRVASVARTIFPSITQVRVFQRADTGVATMCCIFTVLLIFALLAELGRVRR